MFFDRLGDRRQQRVEPFVRRDGSNRHTTTSSSMLFDTEGTTRRVVASVLDRTDGREVEDKLRRTLALLEEAQRFAQLGSWRFEPHSGKIEWSQEFRRIAGLPLDVAPNIELFFERLVPEDRARFRASHEHAAATLEPSEIDARLQRADGQVRHVRLRGFVMVGADGSREPRPRRSSISPPRERSPSNRNARRDRCSFW
jgi:PAS domain-containing protein